MKAKPAAVQPECSGFLHVRWVSTLNVDGVEYAEGFKVVTLTGDDEVDVMPTQGSRTCFDLERQFLWIQMAETSFTMKCEAK